MCKQKQRKPHSWELPKAIWEKIKPFIIVDQTGQRGRPRTVDFQQILSGIFYILRTGSQWQACPREFGAPSTVYYWFNRWCREGIFKKIWEIALKEYDDLKGLEWKWQSIDSTMNKAPLGGEDTGANPTDRGKKGTKRSVLTEGKGIPLALVITGANRHDTTVFEQTLDAKMLACPEEEKIQENLCGDKGYDSAELRQIAEDHGYTTHIRSRGEEIEDKKKLEEETEEDAEIKEAKKPRRWVVEVCHSWLNRFRKILVRFEKLTITHLGLLQLACSYLVFKKSDIF